MDNFLYSSEYYCEDCKDWHSVAVWFHRDDVNTCYCITDGDGDEVATYEESQYDQMVKEFPEGTPNHDRLHPLPVSVKVKWHAVVRDDRGGMWVDSVKREGRWNDHRGWISPKDAPEIVRLVLGLDDHNLIQEIHNWVQLREGLKALNGHQHRNTGVISFYVTEEQAVDRKRG